MNTIPVTLPLTADSVEDRVVHSVWQTLRVMFGVLAIVVGLDKFTDFVTNWSMYLNPIFLRIVPVSAQTFMRGVGVIEIIVGLIVFAKPRLGAIILTIWFFAIALQLIAMDRYLDIAVRDIVIAIGGSLTLARLTRFARP
jgi:hypothetical protein